MFHSPVTSVTKPSKPILWWIVKHVVPAIALMNLLICLRKCCCNPKSSEAAEAPPVSNQIEEVYFYVTVLDVLSNT